VTRRSILLAILRELRFDLGFLRSWSGDETTCIPATLQGLRDDLRFWLFLRGVGKILGFDDSKMVKKQTFLFLDGYGWFFNSISLGGCRCEISGKRIPGRPAVKFWTLNVWLWDERVSGRADRVILGDASRPAQQYQLRRGTTQRIESTDSADRRGVVGQASTTERMTDTTMRARARGRAQPLLRMQPCKNLGENRD